MTCDTNGKNDETEEEVERQKNAEEMGMAIKEVVKLKPGTLGEVKNK